MVTISRASLESNPSRLRCPLRLVTGHKCGITARGRGSNSPVLKRRVVQTEIHRRLVFIGPKEPLSIKMDHVRWSIGNPHFSFPRDVAKKVPRGERGHSMFLKRGNIEKSSQSRSLAGARLLNDVSTVRDHRLERFKCRKGTKQARRMCDVPEHRRVGVETG